MLAGAPALVHPPLAAYSKHVGVVVVVVVAVVEVVVPCLMYSFHVVLGA